VVVDEEAVEADRVESPDDGHRIEIALAQEALGERRHLAGHVTEVHVADASGRAEGVDHFVDGGLAAHLGDRAQA
jgi:hypothetical protein